MSDDDFPKPPDAPRIERRLRLHPWQWFGVPLLLLLPVLTLLGVFGETRTSLSAETPELSIDLRYPTRYRYKMLNSLRLDVTNRTRGLLDTISIEIDTVYASRFSTVVAIPSFAYPYRIELTDLAPGETRRVRVELQGERYGRHSGEMHVAAAGSDTAHLPLSTFVFP